MKITRRIKAMIIPLAFLLASCSPTQPQNTTLPPQSESPTPAVVDTGEGDMDSESPSEDETPTEETPAPWVPGGPANFGLAPEDYPSGPPNYPSAPGADLQIWAGHSYTDVLAPIVAQYEEATGATVSVVYEDDALHGLMDVDISEFDVLLLHSGAANRLIWADQLEPIEYRNQEDRFYGAALDAVRMGEDIYGVPFSISVPIMVRNTEAIPQAPKTWEELANQIDSQASSPVVVEHLPQHFYPFQTSFGVDFAPTGASREEIIDYGLATENADAYIDWLISQVDSGFIAVTWDSPGGFDVGEMMKNKQTLAYVTTPYTASVIFADLRDDDTFEISAVPAVGDYPARHPVAVTGAFIPRGNENREASQDFIFNYLTTDDALLAFDNHVPATYSANMKNAEDNWLAYSALALEHTLPSVTTAKPDYPYDPLFDLTVNLAYTTAGAKQDWNAYLNAIPAWSASD